jgi:hypothetical protein
MKAKTETPKNERDERGFNQTPPTAIPHDAVLKRKARPATPPATAPTAPPPTAN